MKSINIFISYCSEDKNKMKSLDKATEKTEGLKSIVVSNKRSPKKSLTEKVKEGIKESNYVVPILTKMSISNQWVNQEIGYAEALKKDVYPIVEEDVFKKLKGFIHMNLELPYRFESSEIPNKESYNFRKCYKLLLKDIVAFEKVKEKETSVKIKKVLSTAIATNYRGSEMVVNKKITKKTKFILRVKLSSIEQIFIVYFLFETDFKDAAEKKWVGFTNNLNIDYLVPGEHTKSLNIPLSLAYKIDSNILKTILQERSFELKGNPIKIHSLRFRGDRKILEPIHFYYTFVD